MKLKIFNKSEPYKETAYYKLLASKFTYKVPYELLGCNILLLYTK